MPKDLKYQPITVKTPDGLSISAQSWGDPDGPEILFIHGLMQSHLSWSRQVESELAREFRMVTYDLRGHGDPGEAAGARALPGRQGLGGGARGRDRRRRQPQASGPGRLVLCRPRHRRLPRGLR